MKVLLIIPLFILQATSALNPPRIAVKVNKAFCFPPCTITVEVVIPPTAENRLASVEVAGPSYQSSEIQLDGEAARKRFSFTYTNLGAGYYDVVGTLYNSTKAIDRNVTAFTVLESDGISREKGRPK